MGGRDDLVPWYCLSFPIRSPTYIIKFVRAYPDAILQTGSVDREGLFGSICFVLAGPSEFQSQVAIDQANAGGFWRWELRLITVDKSCDILKRHNGASA